MEDGKEKCESIKTNEELMQKGQRKEKKEGRAEAETRKKGGGEKAMIRAAGRATGHENTGRSSGNRNSNRRLKVLARKYGRGGNGVKRKKRN